MYGIPLKKVTNGWAQKVFVASACTPSLALLPHSSLTHYHFRKNIVTDPARYGKINHKYSAALSISNLHYHIENHHCDEYVRICSDNNWPMMLPKRQLAEEQGNHNSLLSPNPL
jgi:hypothetical protein